MFKHLSSVSSLEKPKDRWCLEEGEVSGHRSEWRKTWGPSGGPGFLLVHDSWGRDGTICQFQPCFKSVETNRCVLQMIQNIQYLNSGHLVSVLLETAEIRIRSNCLAFREDREHYSCRSSVWSKWSFHLKCWKSSFLSSSLSPPLRSSSEQMAPPPLVFPTR